MKESTNVQHDDREVLRNACVQRIEKHLQCSLTRQHSRATFLSPNKSTAVVCAVATKLTKDYYWFQFRVNQEAFLKNAKAEKSYIAFGCESAKTLLLIPARKFLPLLDQLHFSEKGNFWYLQIYPEGDSLVLRPFKKDAKREINLTKLSEIGVRRLHPGSAALHDKFPVTE